MNSAKSHLQLGKIILKNYRTYKGDTTFELSRDLQKTITIIHGAMGHGKTTILDAIYWCLYGENRSADNDSDESILNIDVLKNLNISDSNETLVEIHLYEDDELRYKMSRTIEFIKKQESTGFSRNSKIGGRLSRGIDLNEKITFSYLKGSDWVTSNNPQRIQNTIDSLFPKSLSKYFLFDAELLDNFFDMSDEKNIKVKDGIEKISGLPIIESAITHLDKSSGDIAKNIKDVNLVPINDEILLSERKQNAENKKIQDTDNKLNDFDTDIKTIESFLRTHNEENINSTQQRVDQLAQDISENRKRLNDHSNKMNDWILRSNIIIRLTDSLKKSIEKCNILEKNGEIPIAVSGLALKNILKGNPPKCICGAHLDEGSSEREHIENLLKKNLIDSPIIQNITTGRGYWENLVDEMHQVDENFKKFKADRDQLDTYDYERYQEKKALEKTYESVNLENIREKFQELKDLRNERDSSIEDRSRAKSEKEKAERELEQRKRERSTQMKKNDKYESQNNRIMLANTLEKIFKKYKEVLKDELRNIVARKTTDYFLKLVSREDDFLEVQIRENYKTVVIGKNQTSKSLSAGQSCCLALSYIAAIRDIAEKNYFMLIDSPLHNISQSERVDIANNLPKFLPQTQITLLVQDQEYTGSAKKEITGENIPSVREILMNNNSIWKEYVLKTHNQQKDSSYTIIEEVSL